jgi:hypothetical protein
MIELEGLARDQANLGLDCAEAAGEQLAARREIVGLIGEWKAAGGGDRLPNPADRQRMGKGKLARLGFKADLKSVSKSVSKSDSKTNSKSEYSSGLSVLSARARNLAERGGRSIA